MTPQTNIIEPTKRALVSYITSPFRLSPDDPRNVQFSNIGIARSVVRVLNELGYVVDVIEWIDTRFVPKREYDVFVGHGGCNFEHVVLNLPLHVVKIYFSTGVYWQEFNRREEERFQWLEERRGVRLPYDRWIQHSEEFANWSPDGIICLGNQFARDSYSKFPFVINLNNAACHDDRYDRTRKDFASGRDKFLFFSGGGNVHKGLDLLLEAFVQVEAHLYICQHIEPGFHDIYRHELEDFPNIHSIGPVPLRSPKFYELVDTCNFVILPSCAEGQPGSVVDCMHQGLIPVVSRESNIETSDYGVTLANCSIDEIIRVVSDLSQRPPEWCEQMSRRTRKIALADFSEVAFLRNMKYAIQNIINYKGQAETGIVPTFIDENRNVLIGSDALKNLESRNDQEFQNGRNGIVEVDIQRWKEAQRYEKQTWMVGQGREVGEDRNTEHERNFENYATLQNTVFENAIEIGCGPFTNMVHILKYIKCMEVTLLDPLIDEYLTHPHCTYKHKRLGGLYGKKVHMVAKPIEDFSSDHVFDLVVMINVLEHCFSASKTFEHIISLMPPDGILIFHDKLIPNKAIDVFVQKIYDAGHPLRVGQDLILEFLSKNFDELFNKHVTIPTEAYIFDSIYFIGRKR